MKELVVVFAEILPAEDIIKQLDEAIQEWKMSSTDDNMKKIEMWSMLLMAKRAGEDQGGAEKLMAKMDLQTKGMALLDPTKQ